jgi:hypothetical protein
MRPDAPEARTLARLRDDVVDRLPRHRLFALGHEEPLQLVLAIGKIAFDRAKLIALNRLFRAQRVLAPFDYETRLLEVESVEPNGRPCNPKS